MPYVPTVLPIQTFCLLAKLVEHLQNKGFIEVFGNGIDPTTGEKIVSCARSIPYRRRIDLSLNKRFNLLQLTASTLSAFSAMIR